MSRILKTAGLLFKLLILTFLSGIIASLFTMILPGGYEQNEMLALVLSYCIAIPILYKYYGKEDCLMSKCNFKKISSKDLFYIILLGIGLSSVISLIIDPLVSIFPSYIEVSNEMSSKINSVVSVLCVVILVPIFEEIVFRGIIFDHLKRNYSLVTAIIVQALLFGLVHGNIVQGIYTFLAGIVFVLANIYCGSILGSIILHIIFNSGIEELLGFNDTIYNMELILGVILFVYASYKMIKNYKKQIYDCKVN
ncbi:CPBP family intramembrane glutamic endopeptidase [Paraclostridium bifermentans]|uniref:CPBP family intramembrane glutamic endopeptidase n=1 Tax=Paraclostridium bifermentans TaxID=1490 RepID=UPI00359C1F4B